MLWILSHLDSQSSDVGLVAIANYGNRFCLGFPLSLQFKPILFGSDAEGGTTAYNHSLLLEMHGYVC